MGDRLKNINMSICSSCGQENETQSQFCIYCGNPILKRGKINFKRHYLLLGLIGLILIVSILFFMIEVFNNKFIARVNGEGITRKDFLKRTNQAKKFYESRYGQNIFMGEAGKENMNRLKNSILDEMVTEKILLQEAKKAGYTLTSIPEKEIEERIDAIKRTYRLSNDDLKKMIGRNLKDLKEELRTELTISKFLQKTVLEEGQGNPDQIFGQWLSKVKANAKIETFEEFGPLITKKASCCTSGCGGGVVSPLDPKTEKEAKAKALEYYEKKTQKKDVEAKVTNYGCHIQVDIIDNGKVVLSLTYNGKEVQEI
jgi:hypothetical protein